eukprot:5564187-Pleurochrysis_carterae.AAC.2
MEQRNGELSAQVAALSLADVARAYSTRPARTPALRLASFACSARSADQAEAHLCFGLAWAGFNREYAGFVGSPAASEAKENFVVIPTMKAVR